MTSGRNRSAFGGALIGAIFLLWSPSAPAQSPAGTSSASAPVEVPAVPPTTLPTPATPATPSPSSPQPAPLPAATEPTPTPPPPQPLQRFEIFWNNGLYLQTQDKKFVSHWGATVQYDFSWYSASPILEQGLFPADGIGKFLDGANLRRARVFSEGTLWDAVDYKIEMEFMNGIGFSPAGTTDPTIAGSIANSPGPTDAWVDIKDVPFFGKIRVGSQKEWFSLEHINNYRALEFMERSFLFDLAQATAFNNGFSPGISAYRTWANNRIFTGIGMYKNISSLIGFGYGDGQYAVTGRVCALPIWQPDDERFWSIGGAMSHRDPVDNQVQIRIRDNVRDAPFPLLPLLVNTKLLDASSQDLFNLETAAVWGPLTLQAEYTATLIHDARQAVTSAGVPGPPQGTLFFQGYYTEMMWLLTGESRKWNTNIYQFDRVIPRRPFHLKRTECDGRGFGALELAARYSYADVSNKAIQAGRLDSVTLGVNWYLNASVRFQLNYDYTHIGDKSNSGQGHVSAVGIRSQFDF
jgi:phosphate-selective porin OprO/OprP